jgi:hypothetical protein
LYDVFSFATWIFFLTSITIPIEIQRQLWHAVAIVAIYFSVNDELHVQTDCEDDDPKSSPHSWSHPSPVEPAKINRNNRYSMPELPLNFFGTSPPERLD